MRIGMTHYAFYPTTGGVESHLLDLCAELVEQGHEVHAIVGSHPDCADEEEFHGIQIHRCALMNPEIIRDRKKAADLAAEVVWPELQQEVKDFYRESVNTYQLEVLHGHNFHHFLPEYGLAMTELYEEGLPVFLTVHEVWSEFICEDLLARTKWNTIITVSEHVRKGIQEQAPHLDNLRLVYHGIDTQKLFTPEVGPNHWAEELGLKGRPVIIHPARMLPWKGVLYSIEALERLVQDSPDILMIITDTEDIIDWIDELRGYKEQVLQAIEEKGLTENVLTQPFPYPELPGVYNACDVVIYPTIGEEPFGLVPVEGMACGKPVVVTRSGGLVESVIDGKTGFIIDKRDPEALAEKIGFLLKHRDLAQQMGQAGREHAVKAFSRERMAREVAELYEEAGARKELYGPFPRLPAPEFPSRDLRQGKLVTA